MVGLHFETQRYADMKKEGMKEHRLCPQAPVSWPGRPWLALPPGEAGPAGCFGDRQPRWGLPALPGNHATMPPERPRDDLF